MKTPFQLGIHAALNGKRWQENPYSDKTANHMRWLAGWCAYKNKLGEIL